MTAEVTYLKCPVCGAFYEADTEHICRNNYFRSSAVSKQVANEIKDIISRRMYGVPYEHDDPHLYRMYESVIFVAKFNLKINPKYPWSKKDAEKILSESKRILRKED